MGIDFCSEKRGQFFWEPPATLVSRLLCPFLLRKHFGEDYLGRHSFQKLGKHGNQERGAVALRPFVCHCAPRAPIHETCLQRAITDVVREDLRSGRPIKRDIKID